MLFKLCIFAFAALARVYRNAPEDETFLGYQPSDERPGSLDGAGRRR
jgi:hypothetical protein